MSANAIERIRANAQHILEGPGAFIPGGELTHIADCPGCLIEQDAAAVEALLEVTKRALVYWDADDVDSLDSVMLEVEKAIRRVESGQ